MRKCMSWLLLLAMLMTALGTGYAEEAGASHFILAGYDQEATNHVWETNEFFQRMEERTGIDFTYDQYVSAEKWAQAKVQILNGTYEMMPDVLFKPMLTQEDQMAGYENGTLIDLKPYLEQYAPNLWGLLQAHPDWLKAITLPSGAIVALPGVNQLQNNNAMWINTDWLETLKLEVPTTPEELTEVLRAFKNLDPNNNGKKDEVPMTFTGMWDLRYLGHAFGLVSNDYYVTMDEAGQVSSILTTEENRAFLTWLHQLWEEELIDDRGFSSIDSTRRITENDDPITFGMFLAPTPLNMVPSEAMDQYTLLMPFTYEGKQIYRDFAGDLVPGTYAVTSACEDPAALVSWVDYLYTEEGCHLMQAGLENEEFIWNSDGTWSWMYDAETVATQILSETTISDGAPAPGLSSVDFQLTFDDENTMTIVRQLMNLKEVAVQPYPIVWLTEEQQAKVNAIQMDAGYYAEQQMVWFVTGDMELNDATWNDFCRTLSEKGMDDMVAIWQEAVR